MADNVAAKLVGPAKAQVDGALARVGNLAVSCPLPGAFGWDRINYPLSPTVYETPFGPSYGSAGYSPFDSAEYAACRAGAQIWYGPSGNDTTGNGTQGLPFRGLSRAQTALNATGAPGTIRVIAGNHTQADSQLTVTPTVDTCYLVSGAGTAWLRTFNSKTWTADATFPNLMYAPETNTVVRALNPQVLNAEGGPSEYIDIASKALCAVTPGSRFADGTNVYVCPVPGQSVISNSNCHLLLNRDLFNIVFSGSNLAVNLFWDTATQADAWLLEGGQKGGITVVGHDVVGARKIAAARGVRSIGAGSATYGNGSFYPNRWHGIAYFEKCHGEATQEDVFNLHNNGVTTGTAICHLLTVNCSGRDTGRGSAISCNYWTGHDLNTFMVDICGDYGPGARGQGCHIVGNCQAVMIMPRSRDSRGDVSFGGTFYPCEFRAADTSKMWLHRAEAQPAAPSSYAMLASDTSVILLKDMPQVRGRIAAAGSGTIGTWST